MAMRILVTGSRYWKDVQAVYDAIYNIASKNRDKEVVVVHGNCPTGADAMAKEYVGISSLRNILDHEPHDADWDRYGRAAGPIRNQEMVDAGADICLAFPLGESRGTRGCMKMAEDAGIEVANFGDN